MIGFRKQYDKEIEKWELFRGEISSTHSGTSFWEYLIEKLIDALKLDIFNDKGRVDFIKIIFTIGQIAAKIKVLIDAWKNLKETQKQGL